MDHSLRGSRRSANSPSPSPAGHADTAYGLGYVTRIGKTATETEAGINGLPPSILRRYDRMCSHCCPTRSNSWDSSKTRSNYSCTYFWSRAQTCGIATGRRQLRRRLSQRYQQCCKEKMGQAALFSCRVRKIATGRSLIRTPVSHDGSILCDCFAVYCQM
jgi:hypothetical protein